MSNEDMSPEMGLTKEQLDKRQADNLRIAASTLRHELQRKDDQYRVLLRAVECACQDSKEPIACLAFGEYDAEGNFIAPANLPNIHVLQCALEACYDRAQRIEDESVGPVEAKMHARMVVQRALIGLQEIKGVVSTPTLVNVGSLHKLIADLWQFILAYTNHRGVCKGNESICACGYDSALKALDARVNSKPAGLHEVREYVAKPLPPGTCPECGGECQVIDASGDGSSRCFTCQGSGVVKPDEKG